METNLHKFQAFTSAAYHSSFTVAAEELGCTQSSISRMVASLEKEWDVRLFNRHGGYVSLTPEGKTLLPVAEEVCQAYSKLSNQVNRVSAIEMGNLIIAAPSSFLSRALPGHLKKYMTDHPNIKVEVIECTYGEALRLISKGKVDISFTMTRTTEQGFTSTLFDHDEVIVVSQKGHYEKDLETIPVKRLIEEPFIVDIETAPLLQKQLKNARMTFASSDSFTIMSMVESGLGVSLLPLEATKGTNFDIDVHHLETPVHRNVFITHRIKGEMSRTTEEFLKYLS